MSYDTKEKKQIVDFIIFILLLGTAIMLFQNENFSSEVDNFLLPEKRHKGYYEILNNSKKIYMSDELLKNGTENLLANYLKSGDRDSGYHIEVNVDGSFTISGKYNGENNAYEYLMGSLDGLLLSEGDYILTDGGVSCDGISLRVVGLQHLIGGETNYIKVASLPEQGSFHWDSLSNIELIVDLVIYPGFEASNLKFKPMLQKLDHGIEEITEFQPCLTPNYKLENGNTELYLYDIPKGSLDGEIVTKDDWDIFINYIQYQMQTDHAVINLLDGTGIEICKEKFPRAVYGLLNASKTIINGHEINLTDYQELLDCKK